METKSYHCDITPDKLAQALVATFNRGNYQAQSGGGGDKVTVQIATRQRQDSGGKTALAITIQKHLDGVTVTMGQQEWWGVAASLGQSALATFMNPWNLLNRLDDIAQDVTSITLANQAWAAIDKFARTAQATQTISKNLASVACPYCGTANKVAAPECVNCGGPLGDFQPTACPKCGNVMPPKSKFCASCGTPLGRG